jgi:hypothetical protein
MHTMGSNPCLRACLTFLLTVSFVSPKYCLRSEWPTMTYAHPALLSMAQETEAEQGGKGAEHSAVRNIIGAFKARFGLIQRPVSGRDPFHGAGGCHSHERLSIGHAAIPLVAWRDWPGSIRCRP